jgi:YggT family protein
VTALLATTTREHIADYVRALLYLYSLIVFAYLLSSLYFSVGGRLPYSRAGNAILDFLRDSSEPYLRIFRRFVPMVGPLDLSALAALIVLAIAVQVLPPIIAG